MKYLGITPYDFDNRYSLNDIDLLAQGKEQSQRDSYEKLRMHCFVLLVGIFGNEKIKKPTQLCQFKWEDGEQEQSKEQDYGLRGMSKEEWQMAIDRFNKKTGGSGHSK